MVVLTIDNDDLRTWLDNPSKLLILGKIHQDNLLLTQSRLLTVSVIMSVFRRRGGWVVKAGKRQGGESISSTLTALFEYTLNSTGSNGSFNISSVNTLYFLVFTTAGFSSSLTRELGRNARGPSAVAVGHSARHIRSHSRDAEPNPLLGASVGTPGPGG